MLTAEQNRVLTQVGPGTPMGNLLRRYWMPIGGVTEFDTISIKPIRLFGEDLALYKDISGMFGLVDRHCPHRRADLSYGFVESCGIRCNYHGWRYDEAGKCVEQPFEDTVQPDANFRDKIHITAYPVQQLGGLLWTYMGPQPAPLLPDWEPFSWTNGFAQITLAKVPCNWFQAQENAIDPVHFEWMHRNWSTRLTGATGPYGKKHVKIDFKEWDFGFTYHRLLEDMPEEHERWAVGRVALWPNCLGPNQHFEWRVPIDDENMLFVMWHFAHVPLEQEPYVQSSIPTWTAPLTDPATGRFISSHVDNQDIIAWVGQGTIADRTKEHLGISDRGVIMMRKRFFDDIARVERGEDPSNIIRDPAKNQRIELPIPSRDVLTKGIPLKELLDDPSLDPRAGFMNLAGQPHNVYLEYLAAMGLDSDGTIPKGEMMLEAAVSSGKKARLVWS